MALSKASAPVAFKPEARKTIKYLVFVIKILLNLSKNVENNLLYWFENLKTLMQIQQYNNKNSSIKNFQNCNVHLDPSVV